MFNFVDALRKKTTRREKKEFDFSRNYNAYGPTWKKVQEAVANANKGAANPRHSAELKKHLRAMLHLVVNERKGQVANPHLKDISLPCFEHMLNREQKVINKLCSYAKGSTVDSLIILHHIADLVLLSAPLLGHYKMATSPLLELLKYIESRLQLRSWRESPSETKAQDHHTRCLSHGFIQLVYCIALQVRDLKSSVQYLFELQGTETHFLLLDFALPYLHRTDEVVTAGEIDYASDLSEADQVYQIYTSEVAIDVLACVFSFQDDAVEYYLMQKREDIAKQVLKNTAFVCKKLLTASKEEEYNEDEYDSKGRFFQQLEHRLELLRIVALHPKMPFRDEVAKAFKEFIVIPILRDRLEAEEDALETVVILTGYILQNLNLVPYSDAILNILLGIEGERDTIKTKLLTALSSNDADLVPAVLKLFYTMLKVRPILVANHLIAPHLYWLVKDHGLTEFSKPIIGAIDGLFHPALFTSKDSEKTAQDQQNAQLALQQAVAQNLCSATVISPVSWTPEAPAETVHLTAEQRQLQLPVLLVERFSTVLMQPFDVTLVCPYL
ncbi:hypothetical protein DIPPA_35717 [Diplonema papillatum]|nr:hypothetical protein DIPPA_35717 [Diplonema papillatum]